MYMYNLAAQQSPAKGNNNLSQNDIQKFRGISLAQGDLQSEKRYKFWLGLK